MFGLGMPELIIILVILLLLFGAKRLPGLAAGLGGAISQFRKSVKETPDEPKQLAQETASREPVRESDFKSAEVK